MENGTAPHTPTDSTDTPASPDSLEVLKGKKKELDRLLVEIQNLELQNLKSSKLSPLREKPSPRPEDEVYRRLMLVEKELKERDSQIERLLYEKRSLAEIVRQQEETILNMTSELQEVKQKNLKLSHALQLKTEESKMLFSESQQSYHTAVGQQQSLIKRLDEEAKEKGRDKASKELYYHVLFLENELKDRDRVLKELKEENNTFAKLLKQCDEDYTALHNQLTEKVSSEVGTGQNVIVLENRIIELENTVRDVQQENKMLLNIQKAKTEAIQQLTEEVTRRGATEEYVEDLKRQLQAKEKEIKDYAEENKQLIRITREKERQIDHLKQQDVGIPFHLWHQERQLLQAEIRNLKETKIAQEKKINDQKERLMKLNDRINFLNKTVCQGRSPLRASTKTTLTARRLNITSSPSTNNDQKVLPDEDSIPASLYDAVEKQAKKLAAQLQAKENLLSEKDDIIEMLQKKLDITTKSLNTDLKLSKKREQELRDQLAVLTERVQFIEEEYRVCHSILR